MKKTIVLHVEDDDDDADLVSLALERVAADWSERVTYVRSRTFAQSMNVLRHNDASLVILDLNLPGRNGHELLRAMKAETDLKSIPVVILSNSGDDDEIRACYASQAAAYLTKPATFAELVDMMTALEHFWLRIAKLPR